MRNHCYRAGLRPDAHLRAGKELVELQELRADKRPGRVQGKEPRAARR